jgi:hypothetical protein
MLSSEAKAKIEARFAMFPTGLRQRLATEPELQEFEAVFGSIPSDYRWLLVTCGGGVVGAERVDGIEQLSRSHAKFRREYGAPRGWTMRDVFIIGWDASGNPFGIELSSGRIVVEDQQFSGVQQLADSLQAFILQ